MSTFITVPAGALFIAPRVIPSADLNVTTVSDSHENQ